MNPAGRPSPASAAAPRGRRQNRIRQTPRQDDPPQRQPRGRVIQPRQRAKHRQLLHQRRLNAVPGEAAPQRLQRVVKRELLTPTNQNKTTS